MRPAQNGDGVRAHRGEPIQEERGTVDASRLSPGQATIAEELRAALRDVDQAGIDRFFEDVDSIVDQDPTPRFWKDF